MAVVAACVGFALGAWWQRSSSSRAEKASVKASPFEARKGGEAEAPSGENGTVDDRKERKKRIMAYPTVVQKTSDHAKLLAAPYRKGLMKVLCRGTANDLKQDFIAVFLCKDENRPTVAASLRRNMRLKLDMVPYEQAPPELKGIAVADDVDDFTLPVYWVHSFQHDDPRLRIALDQGRMQFVDRLPDGVIKSPIPVPCGDMKSPMYFYAGNWGIYSPYAEENLLQDKPGLVRHQVKSFHERLRKLGIKLIFAPIPQSASLYPDVGLGRFDGASLKGNAANSAVTALLKALHEDGVTVCDLTAHFIGRRMYSHEGKIYPAWLPNDTHWSSWAAAESARLIAEIVRKEDLLGTDERAKGVTATSFETRWIPAMHPGDAAALQAVQSLRVTITPVPMYELQVQGLDAAAKSALAAQDAHAPIHLAGDSFLQAWGPNHAGFRAHLVKELGLPVHVVTMAGGGRHGAPHIWWQTCKDSRPKVLVWLMTERDLSLGQWFGGEVMDAEGN